MNTPPHEPSEPSSGPVSASPQTEAPGSHTAASPLAGAAAERRVAPLSRGIRLFVILFVGDLVVRSLLGISVGKKWAEELELRGLPLGLPTQQELAKIAKGNSDYDSAGARYWASVGSIVGYFNPAPKAGTREQLTEASDWGKYAMTWLDTRLRFIGRLTGTNHSWPMFSPNTRRSRTVVRGKLIYDDGTTRWMRSMVEPASFVDYSRWLIKRPQKNDERLDSHYSARVGKCNTWVRRFGRLESGAKLQTIELYKLGFRFPRPGQDVAEHWKKARAKAKPKLFWTYDVATRKGKLVEKDAKKKSKSKPQQPPSKPPDVDVTLPAGGAP